MTNRDPEYDRFGPWILEISEEDPPPPLFLPYLTREETPLFSIKIPRKIDRRAADPGMNLYDYMVMLYEKDLVILQRVGSEVKEETFVYRDVQFMRVAEHLLKGTLHLAMRRRSYDLPFNVISSDIMLRLVDLIRQRYTGPEIQMPTGADPDITQDGLSYLFGNMLIKAQSEYPQLRVLAAQPETAVGFQESNAFRRALYGLARKRLAESLHFTNGRELKVIDRGKTYRYTGQSLYGIDTVYLPISKISGVSWEADENNTAVSHLTMQTDGQTISFPLLSDNPSMPAYTRYLSQLINAPIGPHKKVQELAKDR